MARPKIVKITTYRNRNANMSMTVYLIKRIKMTVFSKIRSQLMNTNPMRNI
jgi:hypothetical protein